MGFFGSKKEAAPSGSFSQFQATSGSAGSASPARSSKSTQLNGSPSRSTPERSYSAPRPVGARSATGRAIVQQQPQKKKARRCSAGRVWQYVLAAGQVSEKQESERAASTAVPVSPGPQLPQLPAPCRCLNRRARWPRRSPAPWRSLSLSPVASSRRTPSPRPQTCKSPPTSVSAVCPRRLSFVPRCERLPRCSCLHWRVPTHSLPSKRSLHAGYATTSSLELCW